MVIMNGNDSKDMYSCRVLYIGSAPPTETLKGVDALQEPLRKRLPSGIQDVEGIDANLRVLPDALEVAYVESGHVLHFPLSRMSICAGVTAVNVRDGTTGENYRQFVPVNTIKHQNSNSPAIFAAIIRRNQGRQIAECHMFMCNCTRDALHLVNAAATANMALKQQRKSQRIEFTGHSAGYGNDVVIVKTGIIDAPQNGHVVNGGQTYERPEEMYIKSDVNTTASHQHYQVQTSNERAASPETIYISFDKSNLFTKEDNVLEVKSSRQRSPSPRPSPRAFEETSMYSYRPIAPPPPPQPQPVMVARPLPMPPPRPVFVRGPPPQPMMIRAPPPQPIMVRAPQPRPVFVRAPPRPMMVQAPPPQPAMVRYPSPQPQRLYTRRTVTVPPPQRYASSVPVNVHSRARSVSPVRGYRETRMSRKGELYQPKWEGDAKRPTSDSGFRMSRRDQFDYQAPPRDFRQPQNMFLNERAFSRRVHGDDRISHMSPGYQYPNAYDFNNITMYDRPTTKSNPRYSSSSDSDDGRDNRMSKSYRR